MLIMLTLLAAAILVYALYQKRDVTFNVKIWAPTCHSKPRARTNRLLKPAPSVHRTGGDRPPTMPPTISGYYRAALEALNKEVESTHDLRESHWIGEN